MVIEAAQVRSNGQLAQGIFSLELEAPAIAAAVRPGQFINILVAAGWSPLLRLPMSVASRDGSRIGLIYKLFGSGTRLMAGWQPGHTVSLLGPLGNGWDLSAPGYPILLGGGVGIAPLNFLHDELHSRGRPHQLVVGARDRAGHFLAHDPAEGITLTTDDGSVGIKGTVLDGLKGASQGQDPAGITVFGCGPPPMLSALMAHVHAQGIACQLATETVMACGFGFCQGCSIEMASQPRPPAHSYRRRYQLACIDGPVFWAHELA